VKIGDSDFYLSLSKVGELQIETTSTPSFGKTRVVWPKGMVWPSPTFFFFFLFFFSFFKFVFVYLSFWFYLFIYFSFFYTLPPMAFSKVLVVEKCHVPCT
jgi:hypothetical protein